MAMIAKLCPPHYDKNYSFQVINISKEHRDAIVACFQHPLVKKANPFLQGDSGDWVMVEFWVKDLMVIQEASDLLARKIGIESFEHGTFTRKDLGLE